MEVLITNVTKNGLLVNNPLNHYLKQYSAERITGKSGIDHRSYSKPNGKTESCLNTVIKITPVVSTVNLLLSEGCFPTHFKSALVSPLLKKTHTQ